MTERPVRVALALAVRDGRVLLARRRPDAHMGGLWEFPGGRIRAGETAAAAARRELREETGLGGGRAVPLIALTHAYPDRTVRLAAFLIGGTRGKPTARASQAVFWKDPAAIPAGRMPAANRLILRALAGAIGSAGVGSARRQTVQARGGMTMRSRSQKHERPDGWSISRSKTLPVPLDVLWRAWRDARVRARWIDEAAFTIRRSAPRKSVRVTWVDGRTSVEVAFEDRGEGRSRISVQHSRLESAREAAAAKSAWGRRLERLGEVLAPPARPSPARRRSRRSGAG